LATAGIALLAGADALGALRLGASMLLLQASIGAVNDIADAQPDGVGKPAKPIPSGATSMFAARTWAGLTCLLGLALALPSGLGTTAIAALPLVPIFAWLGATGSAPSGILALLPAGVLAGAALMTGNSLADLERDGAAGKSTIVVRLGPGPAWRLHAAAFAVAVVLAFVLAPSPALPAPAVAGVVGELEAVLLVLRAIGVPLGAALVAVGVILVRADPASIRERGWELEAVGTAVLGVGWLAGMAAVARFSGAV
jgi:4-hydroxybenzoate polyprenyltransferase